MNLVDRSKLRSLMFHALATSEPGQLSANDLNLIAFLADLIHLGATGETITRETYVRGRWGPVATHLSAVRAALVADGLIQERVVSSGDLSRIAMRLSEKRPEGADAIEPLAAMELSSLGVAIEHLFGFSADDLVPELEAAYDLDSIAVGDVIDLGAAYEKNSAAA